MSYSNPFRRMGGALLTAIASALALSGASGAALESLPESTAGYPARPRHSRGAWGEGDKRYHAVINGKRVSLPPGSARPACKFEPNVKGMRYEFGRLVPRHAHRVPRASKAKQPVYLGVDYGTDETTVLVEKHTAHGKTTFRPHESPA